MQDTPRAISEITTATNDPQVKKINDIISRAAAVPATVLLLGESGTGKSVLARSIHAASPRRDKPFIVVNCPCLNRELLESELFGHQKGSFTGAVTDTWGKVAAAEGGTLFLDEIGELPLEIQPKLLRLLQEREYERVGETKPRLADVRVIAATNRDLTQSVQNRTFREDLYYRLNVITVTVPPLRQRPSDIVDLAEHFLKFVSSQLGRRITRFSATALQMIQGYPWPGNLRELRNLIERACILCDGETIEALDLPEVIQGCPAALLQVGSAITLEDLESEHIRRVVARTESFERAAEILGIDPATLYRKRKRLKQGEPEPLSAVLA